MRRRLKLVALCVVALAGAGAGAWLAGEAAIKARVSDAVLRATGRTLMLAGPLSIRPGLSLSIVANDLSFANAPDGSRPEMARARRLEARVAWLPLLNHEIVVERLTLVEPSVLLETNAEGVPNWRFAPSRSLATTTTDTRAPARPWNVDARLVELRDGRVERRDRHNREVTKALISRLTLEAASAESPVSLSGEVQVGVTLARVTGQVGPASSFKSATAASPWPVRLVAENTMGRVSVTGGFARPEAAQGYALALEAGFPDLSALSGPAGFALPAFKGVTVAAQLADAGDVSGVAIHAGASDFAVAGHGILHVDHLDVAAPRMDAPAEARLDGALAGTAVRLAATLGPMGSLFASGTHAPFRIDAKAEAAGANLRITGGIARPAGFTGLDVAVTGGIPDLAALSPIAGHQLPGFHDLAFAANVTDRDGGYRSGIALRDIVVTAPQGDMSGNMAWRFAGRPDVEADLSSRRLDLDAVRAVFAAQPAPPAGVPSGPPPSASEHAAPAIELPFAALNRVDGDVRLAVDELRIAGITLAGFVGRAVLREGKLALDPVGGQGAGGRLDMTASVDAGMAEPPVALSLRGGGIAVKPVFAAFGWPGAVVANADVSVDLHAQGRTIHALAAGLAGHAALAVADGEVDNGMLSAALGGFMRAARLPGEFGGGRTSIRCLAVRLDAAHGVVAATTMLLDTTRLMLQGTGQVDLGDERVAVRLRPLLRTGGPGLVVPVKIGGTLREPKVTLDSGSLLGALMAGERRAVDPCPPALTSARMP